MNADLSQAARASMSVIDRLQTYQPGEQIASLAGTFKLMAERFGIDPADAFQAVEHMMRDADRRLTPEFGAVKLYMEGEL